MIKLCGTLLATALTAAATGTAAAEDVVFDINAYCARVANAVGGSYQIEEACRQQEGTAREAMRESSERIVSYCAQVAETVGGSYQIYNSCVDQEEAARARMSGWHQDEHALQDSNGWDGNRNHNDHDDSDRGH